MNESITRMTQSLAQMQERTAESFARTNERINASLPGIVNAWMAEPLITPPRRTRSAQPKRATPKAPPQPPLPEAQGGRTVWDFLAYELAGEQVLPKPAKAPRVREVVASEFEEEEPPLEWSDKVALVAICLFAAGLRWLLTL